MEESNILIQIANHWDKEIIKSLLLRQVFDSGVEFETSREVEELQDSEAETDLENAQPNRGKKRKTEEPEILIQI